jgi:hypothetical protein
MTTAPSRGKRPARWSAPVLACAAIAAGALAAPAAAFHIPGATYGGDVSGGGTISFTVSGDGGSVTNLALNGPIGRPDCTVASRRYSQPIPIASQAFDNGEVSGTFPNVRGAYGRFNVVVSQLTTSCRVTGTWSAITAADPAGSKECKSAKADVKRAKRALRRAMKAGKQARIKKLRHKWAVARSKRDQFC